MKADSKKAFVRPGFFYCFLATLFLWVVGIFGLLDVGSPESFFWYRKVPLLGWTWWLLLGALLYAALVRRAVARQQGNFALQLRAWTRPSKDWALAAAGFLLPIAPLLLLHVASTRSADPEEQNRRYCFDRWHETASKVEGRCDRVWERMSAALEIDDRIRKPVADPQFDSAFQLAVPPSKRGDQCIDAWQATYGSAPCKGLRPVETKRSTSAVLLRLSFMVGAAALLIWAFGVFGVAFAPAGIGRWVVLVVAAFPLVFDHTFTMMLDRVSPIGGCCGPFPSRFVPDGDGGLARTFEDTAFMVVGFCVALVTALLALALARYRCRRADAIVAPNSPVGE